MKNEKSHLNGGCFFKVSKLEKIVLNSSDSDTSDVFDYILSSKKFSKQEKKTLLQYEYDRMRKKDDLHTRTPQIFIDMFPDIVPLTSADSSLKLLSMKKTIRNKSTFESKARRIFDAMHMITRAGSYIQNLSKISYSVGDKSHDDKFFRLWSLMRPGVHVDGIYSDDWEELGFQSHSPGSDIRTGMVNVDLLTFLAENFPALAQKTYFESLGRPLRPPTTWSKQTRESQTIPRPILEEMEMASAATDALIRNTLSIDSNFKKKSGFPEHITPSPVVVDSSNVPPSFANRNSLAPQYHYMTKTATQQQNLRRCRFSVDQNNSINMAQQGPYHNMPNASSTDSSIIHHQNVPRESLKVIIQPTVMFQSSSPPVDSDSASQPHLVTDAPSFKIYQNDQQQNDSQHNNSNCQNNANASNINSLSYLRPIGRAGTMTAFNSPPFSASHNIIDGDFSIYNQTNTIVNVGNIDNIAVNNNPASIVSSNSLTHIERLLGSSLTIQRADSFNAPNNQSCLIRGGTTSKIDMMSLDILRNAGKSFAMRMNKVSSQNSIASNNINNSGNHTLASGSIVDISNNLYANINKHNTFSARNAQNHVGLNSNHTMVFPNLSSQDNRSILYNAGIVDDDKSTKNNSSSKSNSKNIIVDTSFDNNHNASLPVSTVQSPLPSSSIIAFPSSSYDGNQLNDNVSNHLARNTSNRSTNDVHAILNVPASLDVLHVGYSWALLALNVASWVRSWVDHQDNHVTRLFTPKYLGGGLSDVVLPLKLGCSIECKESACGQEVSNKSLESRWFRAWCILFSYAFVEFHEFYCYATLPKTELEFTLLYSPFVRDVFLPHLPSSVDEIEKILESMENQARQLGWLNHIPTHLLPLHAQEGHVYIPTTKCNQSDMICSTLLHSNIKSKHNDPEKNIIYSNNLNSTNSNDFITHAEKHINEINMVQMPFLDKIMNTISILTT